MKTVKYLDHEFEVPDWTKFVAADSDGEVWAFSAEPVWRSDEYGGGYDSKNLMKDKAERVGYVVPSKPPVLEVN